MDAPQMTIEDAITEAQHDLWTLRQMQPLRQVGTEAAYVCPARFYIEDLQRAVQVLESVAVRAREEIPEDITYRIDQGTRRFGPGEVDEVASQSPEVRRYVAVRRVWELLVWLVEDLENEGRPRPAQSLKLRRAKSTSDKEREIFGVTTGKVRE